jgi:hypothetical protein
MMQLRVIFDVKANARVDMRSRGGTPPGWAAERRKNCCAKNEAIVLREASRLLAIIPYRLLMFAEASVSWFLSQ